MIIYFFLFLQHLKFCNIFIYEHELPNEAQKKMKLIELFIACNFWIHDKQIRNKQKKTCRKTDFLTVGNPSSQWYCLPKQLVPRHLQRI